MLVTDTPSNCSIWSCICFHFLKSLTLLRLQNLEIFLLKLDNAKKLCSYALIKLLSLYCFQVFYPELQFPEFTSAVADLKNFVADRNHIKTFYAGLFIFANLGLNLGVLWMHVDCGLRTSWVLPTLERMLQQPAWSPTRIRDRLVAAGTFPFIM